MQEQLKAMFTVDQIAAAAEIGASSEPIGNKIIELFSVLDDPMLSSDEVATLLNAESAKEVVSAMNELVVSGDLEVSTSTLRPLDPPDTTLYRSTSVAFSRLKLVAIESQLSNGDTHYQFTCDGRLIRMISRIDRLDSIAGTGQQREEIKKHVQSIADGIRNGIQVPNAILIAFMAEKTAREPDEGEEIPQSFAVVRPLQQDWFDIPSSTGGTAQKFRTVEIDIPFRKAAFDNEKCAWLVDGQQRTAALSFVDIEDVPEYPIAVNALVTDSDAAKRVFNIANSTVKIATQFSRALLASMDDAPQYLKAEQARAIACEKLAIRDANSPFYKLVQYPGTKLNPRPPVAYNSLFQIVSAFAESALPLQTDSDKLAETVARSFVLVRKHWPEAWGKKPDKSRLMHGVGLRATAALLTSKLEVLTEVHKTFDSEDIWTALDESLARLKTRVVWTDEEALGASNAVKKLHREQIASRQNTNQDIAALSSFLKKESLALDMKAK